VRTIALVKEMSRILERKLYRVATDAQILLNRVEVDDLIRVRTINQRSLLTSPSLAQIEQFGD
jgi:hypothetical protein